MGAVENVENLRSVPQGKGASGPQQLVQEARERSDHAYADTSKVDLTQEGAKAEALAPPSQLGQKPPSKKTKQCLAKQTSNTVWGETYDRWMWCQKYRIGFKYYLKVNNRDVYKGSVSLAYNMVTVGHGKTRTARTYFQARQGSVAYDDWNLVDRYATAPYLNFSVIAECIQDAKYCQTVRGAAEHTWEDWDVHKEWKYWDTYSHEEASTAKDKVLFHQWHLRWKGGGNGYHGPDGTTAERTIRCDSANYFQSFGVRYPKACVNYDVVPRLTYRISDARVRGVARHIRTAQNEPTKTYPIEFDPKVIPGKFTGTRDDRGLRRVPDNGVESKANEDIKKTACERKAPYEGWRGLPPFNTKTHDCDEYPFASTAEGAASWDWAFSVRAVPYSENRAAGALLTWYYFSDRILYGQDEFWVQIRD